MNRTTIKEQGLRLPIGELKDGKLVKEFTLRSYKGKVDRLLNTYREANEGRSIAYLAAKYLSMIVETAGGVAYPLLETGDSSPEQESRMHGWFFADFLYAYVYSRIVNVSEWIEVPAVCPSPRCNYKGTPRADLWTTDVTVFDDPGELHTWINLRDGIRVGDRVSKRIKLQAVRYRAMLLSGAQDVNSVSYSQLREAIVEIEGVQPGYVPTDTDLDALSKFDLLRIDRQAGVVAAGLDLRTVIQCPKCGMDIRGVFSWAFDPFFDTSVPLDILTA